MTRKLVLLAGAGLLALVSGAFLLSANMLVPQHHHRQQAATPSAAIGGPFGLVSSDEKTVTDQTYRGKWLLVYFGYTHCPDACPTTLNNMSAALEKLGAEAGQIQPLFITVDPKRDTPRVMRDYLRSFDRRILGLTGTPEQVDGVTKAYRVYVEPHEGGGDDYLVNHNSYVYIMNPQGKFADVISGDVPGDEMAKKIHDVIANTGT